MTRPYVGMAEGAKANTFRHLNNTLAVISEMLAFPDWEEKHSGFVF